MMPNFDTAFALIPSICFITDGETIEETNHAFRSFFGCASTEQFLAEYRCVCNLFEARQGYLQKWINGQTWVEHIVRRPDTLHKAVIRSNVFSIVANAYAAEDKMRYVVLMQKLDAVNTVEKTLLEQYKSAVDRSAIVSKTDNHGIITYINDRFCDISGYGTEELLGRSHNVVRHPDMPRETFDRMWRTITAKRPWYGIIKNRKKDGSAYYVDTVINPITDCDGEIIEFISIRYDVTHLETMKNNLYDELEETQKELIYRLGELSESRSLETGNHVKRVAEYSRLLAVKAGLSEHDAALLYLASPMHDIGKIAIPDRVLHKHGELDDAEREIMSAHCQTGYALLNASDRPILRAAAVIAHEHHERWDGTGYPRRLKGEQIHIYGRITSLTDVFDALGSERSYKKAWDDERIFAYLSAESGRRFDPALVEIFFANLDQFLQIREAYRSSM